MTVKLYDESHENVFVLKTFPEILTLVEYYWKTEHFWINIIKYYEVENSKIKFYYNDG